MVNWTAEKDQVILKGIFDFLDIKSSAPLLKYLSEQVGDGCTPKAVSHRLSNLRKSGAPKMSADGTRATPTKKTAATPRTPRTPASPRGRGKGTSGKKPLDNDTADDESLNDLEFDTLPSPSTERHRRGITMQKRSYVESDADSGEEEVFTPKSKKVKSEPVDDEDESGMSKTEGELEDDDEGISFV